MNMKLEERLDLFLENTQSMKAAFMWRNTLIKQLAALLYAIENKPVDSDEIRACHALIKENTGVFSAFRGNLSICIAALLSLSGSRDSQLSDTLAVYNMMKKSKFKASDYLVVAAYQIAASTDAATCRQAVDRARAFYNSMRENHRFHTGKDDYIFAAMLALSDIDIELGANRMEQLYKRLRPEFGHGNGVQALSQVLVLGGETGETTGHVLELCDALYDRKIRLDKEYTLSSLGVLSLLPVEAEAVADDIEKSYEFLRTQRGFSVWSVSKQELFLFAAAIVASVHTDNMGSGILTTALSTSITNIMIAQQAAIVSIAAASSAIAVSSSSSG